MRSIAFFSNNLFGTVDTIDVIYDCHNIGLGTGALHTNGLVLIIKKIIHSAAVGGPLSGIAELVDTGEVGVFF